MERVVKGCFAAFGTIVSWWGGSGVFLGVLVWVVLEGLVSGWGFIWMLLCIVGGGEGILEGCVHGWGGLEDVCMLGLEWG